MLNYTWYLSRILEILQGTFLKNRIDRNSGMHIYNFPSYIDLVVYFSKVISFFYLGLDVLQIMF